MGRLWWKNRGVTYEWTRRRERMGTNFFIVTTILLLLLVGCTIKASPVPPVPVPSPPASLQNLPQAIQTKYSDDANLNRGGIVVWELPGLPPTDPNSAYMGHRGSSVGKLKFCELVTATQYAWSETDQTYWVHVETDNVQGWVRQELLTTK